MGSGVLQTYRTVVYCREFVLSDTQWAYSKGICKNPLLGNHQVFYIDGMGSLQQDRRVRGRKKSLELLCRMLNTYPAAGAVSGHHQPCRLPRGRGISCAIYYSAFQGGTVEYHMLNPIIGAHAGPGAIGVFFMATSAAIEHREAAR